MKLILFILALFAIFLKYDSYASTITRTVSSLKADNLSYPIRSSEGTRCYDNVDYYTYPNTTNTQLCKDAAESDEIFISADNYKVHYLATYDCYYNESRGTYFSTPTENSSQEFIDCTYNYECTAEVPQGCQLDSEDGLLKSFSSMGENEPCPIGTQCIEVCKSKYKLIPGAFCDYEECPAGTVKGADLRCYSDGDGDGVPDNPNQYPDGDADGDGSSNGNDSAPNDPAKGEGDSNAPGCSGKDSSNYEFYGIPANRSDYKYEGKTAIGGTCKDYYISLAQKDTNVLGGLEYYDTSSTCENSYCYILRKETDCDAYLSSEYIPDGGGWVYRAGYKSVSCQNLINDDLYDDIVYIEPDNTNCYGLGFCYAHKDISGYEPDDPETNTTNPTDSDFNTTDPKTDLSPILEAQNNTNDLLTSTNKKLNENNKNLEQINEALTLQNDSFNTLNESTLNVNKNLATINETLLSNNLDNAKGLSNINKSVLKTNDSINKLNNDMNALFTGDNPFPDEFSDGSEDFDNYSTELESKFETFWLTDPLGVSALGSTYNVPTIQFNIQGHNFVLFDANLFNMLPIDLIRSIFLFIAAMGGIFTFFRTT